MNRIVNDKETREIGRKLKELRMKLQVTQQEFANKLYWDVSSYQKIERGKTLMTLDKAVQLHREYDVDLNYFIAGDPCNVEDVLGRTVISVPREESIQLFIRLFEYMISFLESDAVKKDPEDGE